MVSTLMHNVIFFFASGYKILSIETSPKIPEKILKKICVFSLNNFTKSGVNKQFI